MNVLLVTERDDLRERVSALAESHGLGLVHYWHPIKALDNLDEVAPDVVLWSHDDFPRHWKPLVMLLRSPDAPIDARVVLLSDSPLPERDRETAQELGIAGIVDESLTNLHRLLSLSDAQFHSEERRAAPRLSERDAAAISMTYTEPQTMRLITGVVLDASCETIRFRPHERSTPAPELQPATRLTSIGIRFGGSVYILSGKVIEARSGWIRVAFVWRSPADKAAFARYVQDTCDPLLAPQSA